MTYFSTIEGDGDIVEWVSAHMQRVREVLALDGACVLRGFLTKSDSSQSVLELLGGDLMEDVFWSTPRHRVQDKTFTATEYAANREISCHSEMSYAPSFPRLISFNAQICAESGGETTIADLDKVSQELQDILEKFEKRGVQYQRIFRESIDIPLAKAFGVGSLDEVFALAQRRGLVAETFRGNSLRISYAANAVLYDTTSSSLLWFNQSNLFHAASLDVKDRSALEEYFGIDGLPRNAMYADGSPIADSVIQKVNSVFQKYAHPFSWMPGDLIVLDNLRFAHGRRPFRGTRKVHVAMSLPCSGGERPMLWATTP